MKSVKSAKKPRPLAKNVLRAPRVKNVLHARLAKIASHVASVKSGCVYCASLWMLLRRKPLLP